MAQAKSLPLTWAVAPSLAFPLGDNSDITLTRDAMGELFVTWEHRDALGHVAFQGYLPHAIKHHSEDFETGSAGSGPADLALNILAAFFPAPPRPVSQADHVSAMLIGGGEARRQLELIEAWEEATVLCARGQVASRPAWYLHQSFKAQFLSMALARGCSQTIRGSVIREWAYDRLEEAETEDYLAKAA